MESPADRLDRLASSLPRRTPRRDLADVSELAARVALRPPARVVAVVGTNGKTSTATFLIRLLAAGGLRVGLTVSPHLSRWSERILVDGAEVDAATIADRVARLADAGAGLDLRFFDLVTFAAAQLFDEHRVDVGVFEAGIGGRLDATRTLLPQLVLLTSVALDHTELLGGDEPAILAEKLGVAAPGTVVLSAPLGVELEDEARRLAVRGGLRLEFPAIASPNVLGRNTELARAAAARILGGTVATGDPGAVRGRLQRENVDGVEVLLDAAHNPQAWNALAAELPERFVAVVSVSSDKAPAQLAAALQGAAEVVATTAWPGRSLPASELAAAVRGEVVEDPRAATRAGLARARTLGVPLAVFGSAYLLRHAFDALGLADPA